ncbi:MAG TPA: TIGR03435 family protein [Acidobacteriaceae bacterium]|nr:TIGR03435 family protein [Acidobacteriaceae bacterium]
MRTGIWRRIGAGVVALGLASSAGARAQEGTANRDYVKPQMMPKDADPDWDVVVVKPSDPNENNATFDIRGRHIIVGDRTVETILLLAYGMQRDQIVGGPEWIRTARFDADGVPNVEGQPSLEQFRSMLRKLLAERFGLVTHREQRELSIYALTVGKDGPKMASSKADPNALQSDSDNQNGGQRSIQMTNATMDGFVLELLFNTDRPVVNKTGLTGRYDFTLKWTFDETKAPADGSAAPSLFTAIQEQMGLKLDAVKAMADVLVIDKVERPGAN